MSLTHVPTYYQDPRDYLRAEFAERSMRNSRYSLRAFARDIGLSPSTLSEVLNGHHGLSRIMALKSGARINLNSSNCENFADLFEARFSKSSEKKQNALLRIQHRKSLTNENISLDAFRVISDWQYMTILELVGLPECPSSEKSTQWLSQKLGLQEKVVQESVDRLQRLGLLILAKDHKWVATDDFTGVGENIPSLAIRRFHRQILEKALQALDFQTVEQREVSSTVFSLDKTQLTAAKAELRKFRLDFANKYTSATNKNAVYCLSFQLFNLIEEGTEQ
ncbi:MAG: TIGR02147 family protein [Bdellovibrio sp.]|nr:TIGR02147 family protein [Bdellovibrio sp.]